MSSDNPLSTYIKKKKKEKSLFMQSLSEAATFIIQFPAKTTKHRIGRSVWYNERPLSWGFGTSMKLVPCQANRNFNGINEVETSLMVSNASVTYEIVDCRGYCVTQC